MANLVVKNGAGVDKYLKTSGAGSDGDPHVPEHLEINSAAIKAAVETIDNAIAGNEMQVDVVTLPALAAGSNTIGKVLISDGTDTATVTAGGLLQVDASGVTVPVSDAGGSITVDGTVAATQSGTWNVQIAQQALQFATGTVSSSGDNTIIAAPVAGQEIKIVALQLQNESSAETTMILKFGATAKWRLVTTAKPDGMVIPIPAGRAWPVGDNVALVLNLSGANSSGYNVAYYVAAV